MAQTRRQLLTTAQAALVTPLAAIGSVAYIARREPSQTSEDSIVVLDIGSEDDEIREQYNGGCAPVLTRSTTLVASCEVRSTSTPPTEDDADARLTSLVEVVRGVLLGPATGWAIDHARIASRAEYRVGASEADIPTALCILAVELQTDGVQYEA